jgi:hypothetical protein
MVGQHSFCPYCEKVDLAIEILAAKDQFERIFAV